MKQVINIIIVMTMIYSNNGFGQEGKLVTSLTIDHLIHLPTSIAEEATSKTYPLILALHGHGSNETDLISLSTHLQDNLFWVSGRGPHTIGKNSYDWYEVTQMGTPDPEKIAIALSTLNTFIEELIATYPIDTNKIFLLGFSQGSMISMSYIMAYPNRIAGVIAQSGYIPPNIGVKIDSTGINKKQIIITHGIEDPNMPITWGRKTRDTLLDLGAVVEYKEFHMGHSISNESLQAIKNWLEKLL